MPKPTSDDNGKLVARAAYMLRQFKRPPSDVLEAYTVALLKAQRKDRDSGKQ